MRPVADILLAAALALALCRAAAAAKPTSGEMRAAADWAAAHLKLPTQPARVPSERAALPKGGLLVLANNGPVQMNSRAGEPLQIGTRTFKTGLYCHATSMVIIRLPSRGERLTATVGVDARAGGGSVIFSVSAGGKKLYSSDVLRGGEEGVRVDIGLEQAEEICLEVSDAGDGITCDQADWADAVVGLADGSLLTLGDLPMLDLQQPVGRTRFQLPFSFIYDGRSSDGLLPGWKQSRRETPLDGKRRKVVMEWREPEGPLVVRCEAVAYLDYPTVEWTLYFRNHGSTSTGLIESIQTMDISLRHSAGTSPLLHHFVGSICAPGDYQPLETRLDTGTTKRITTSGGRPTNSDMPYFNIDTGGGGVIAAVGWAGQWAAQFSRTGPSSTRVCAGQELTSFRLLPGEEVRAPLSVLQFYRGDWHRAQNVWRSWMLEHNTPRPGGQPIRPMASACNGNHYPGIITNASEEMLFMTRYLEEGIRPDFWWQDAGWYPCDPGDWTKTGTWEVDRSRWPQGIRQVSDFCRDRDIKTIVWFEPERVHAESDLARDHPEWIHGGAAGGLLDMGNASARRFVTGRIDRLIREEGIDVYRQDFNIDPLHYWRAADQPGRLGLTEIAHVTGYLAFWNELLRRHPGMLIDSCSSGGRRNDIETLRRAVPLLRSDYLLDPVGEQCHTYGISFWIPFNGTGFTYVDKYLIRSLMSPEFTLGVDTRRRDLDYPLLRQLYNEWREVSGCLLGDYWPLTPYSLSNDVWVAWQFDRPDLKQGIVQAFRRAGCGQSKLKVKLRGLDRRARYAVRNVDSGQVLTMTGASLMDEGLDLSSATCPEALLYRYERSAGN